MTYDEKIKWLRRYMAAVDKERLLRERIETVRARAQATTQALRPVCGRSGVSDKVGDGVELLDKYQREMCNQIADAEQVRREIEHAIRQLPDALQRNVMEARYIDGLQWWMIANRLYISERWARKLHAKALQALQTVPLSSASPC